jgi:hypothetical protein
MAAVERVTIEDRIREKVSCHASNPPHSHQPVQHRMFMVIKYFVYINIIPTTSLDRSYLMVVCLTSGVIMYLGNGSNVILFLMHLQCTNFSEFNELSEDEELRLAIRRSRTERTRIIYESDSSSSEDEAPLSSTPSYQESTHNQSMSINL